MLDDKWSVQTSRILCSSFFFHFPVAAELLWMAFAGFLVHPSVDDDVHDVLGFLDETLDELTAAEELLDEETPPATDMWAHEDTKAGEDIIPSLPCLPLSPSSLRHTHTLADEDTAERSTPPLRVKWVDLGSLEWVTALRLTYGRGPAAKQYDLQQRHLA